MTNLLAQSINCNDRDRAAKLIHDALDIESNDFANYGLTTAFPEWLYIAVIAAAVIAAFGSLKLSFAAERKGRHALAVVLTLAASVFAGTSTILWMWR
jgi:hypothetical protein